MFLSERLPGDEKHGSRLPIEDLDLTDDARIGAVAAWMMDQIDGGRPLYQEHVARHVRQHIGEDLTYRNGNGNWALDKRINDAFKRLSGERVVWERGSQLWRLRGRGDKPGRMRS